jgi:hypothetical protein
MSTELVSVLVGGPGMVALVVAVIGFMQNRRTLRAAQPKSEAERMAIDIESLRSLLAETRTARENDRQDFQYRLTELRGQMMEQKLECDRKIEDIQRQVEEYLDENAIPKPRWWPIRHHHHIHPDANPDKPKGELGP